MSDDESDWIENDVESEEDDDGSVGEYDLTSTPNDFNIRTISDFVSRGVFKIPGFQRNYVWDLRRASKLVESVLLGLPVPQIFLYEQSRNNFLVVDGQQRLMSLYYFTKRRFPRLERRSYLRQLMDGAGQVPADVLANDSYFVNFNLRLPSKLPSQRNRFDGANYDTLGEDQTSFDLRTIRCVVIKQNKPDDDDSSVYEIFNRLNTGGINLTAQEIRTSLYHSDFYRLLYTLNALPEWRKISGLAEPDLRMRDVEIILRGFAMLDRGDSYQPSMTRFLNAYSRDMRKAAPEHIARLDSIFRSFLTAASSLPEGTFGTRSRKLNVSVFESVFAAACQSMYDGEQDRVAPISRDALDRLKGNQLFITAASTKSTNKANVTNRLQQAGREFGVADG